MAKVPFSPVEIRILFDLIEKYGSVLNNNKTDSKSNKLKAKAWDQIHNLFNANQNITQRILAQLRKKFENEKLKRKEELLKQKQEMMGTGGGPPTANLMDMPELDNAIAESGIQIVREISVPVNDSDTLAMAKQRNSGSFFIRNGRLEFLENLENSDTDEEDTPAPIGSTSNTNAGSSSSAAQSSTLHTQSNANSGSLSSVAQSSTSYNRIRKKKSTGTSAREAALVTEINERRKLNNELLEYRVKKAKIDLELATVQLQLARGNSSENRENSSENSGNASENRSSSVNNTH